MRAPLLGPAAEADVEAGAGGGDYLGVPIDEEAEDVPVAAAAASASVSNRGLARSRSVSPAPGLTVRVPGPSLAPMSGPGATPSASPQDGEQLYTPIMTPPAPAAQPYQQPPPLGFTAASNAASRSVTLDSVAHGIRPSAGLDPQASTNAPVTGAAASGAQLRSVLKSSPELPQPSASRSSIGNGGEVRAGFGARPRDRSFQPSASSSSSSVFSSPVPVSSGSTTFFHACTDYRPLLSKRSDYFPPDVSTDIPSSPSPPLPPANGVAGAHPHPHAGIAPHPSSPAVRDVISVVVPCFTESGRSLQKTLYDLWLMQDFMHRNKTYFSLHVCVILDGWSKAPPSLQAYIRQLFQSEDERDDAKYNALQKEVEEEQERNSYPHESEHFDSAIGNRSGSSNSNGAGGLPPIASATGTKSTVSGRSSSEVSSDDTSSGSDTSSDEDDEENPASERHDGIIDAASVANRDVKFEQNRRPLLRARPASASVCPSKSPSSASSRDPDHSTFLFPESLSSFSGLAHPDPEVQSATRSWERYISNWSADSDLNPPTNAETLIVQKRYLAAGDGAAHEGAVKPVALFPELAGWEPASRAAQRKKDPKAPKEDVEMLRRKQSASLKLTVIIKRDNRRKHNSHEWFLLGFAPVYTTRLPATSTSATGVQLVFMTDAGTRFHESCLLSLVQHALQSPTTVACSGRQRVMTNRMQQEGEPATDKWSFGYLRGQLYRCAQGFEYESSISSFNGAFHSVGMLPVLPGPCGLFRLDIILREGDEADRARAVQRERVRIQVGKLRAIQQASSKALNELHSYVWSSLTVTRQMHRATWSAYQKKQQFSQSQSLIRGGSAVLEPFTPYEKAASAFEYVELKTQLFSLTNELQRNQVLLLTVLLRLDPASVCVRDIDGMLASESLMWTRMQSLLVLLAQLHALEASPAVPTPHNWDAQMQNQLQQLRKLLAAQIVALQGHLQRIAIADGGLLAEVKSELSLDQDEQDHLLDMRSKSELAAAPDPVSFYFAIVNQLPNEVDLITANLMLAEDRVLSYCVVLMAHMPVHTDFVPDALFFFECETEAENALQQSRRWTNGTVAGFLWLFCSGIKFRQPRYSVYVLVLAQLIMYAIVGVSPALWTIGLHYSLDVWFKDAQEKFADWIVFFYLGLYSAFVLMHSDPTPGKKRLHVWLFHCLTVVNAGVATMPLAALVPQFICGCRDESQEEGRGWAVAAGMSLQCWILGAAVIGTLVLPFVLAILFDIYSFLPACNKRPVSRRLRNCPYGLSFVWRGQRWGSVTWEMVTSALWFYLFLPTKVSIYPAYAFSRTWELTWGNKPSDSLHSLVSSKTPRQLEQTKKSMLQLSQVISYSLLLANILLFLLVSEIGVKSGALVVLTAFILLWALLQMGMSLLWILYRLLVAPLFKALRIVAEWLDVFAQNQNRPVPAAPAGRGRRRGAPLPPPAGSRRNSLSGASASNAAAPRATASAAQHDPALAPATATDNPKAPLMGSGSRQRGASSGGEQADYRALA